MGIFGRIAEWWRDFCAGRVADRAVEASKIEILAPVLSTRCGAMVEGVDAQLTMQKIKPTDNRGAPCASSLS